MIQISTLLKNKFNMVELKNIVIQGRNNKPILIDACFLDDNALKPIIIFSHGYKGFKDWGAWNIMARVFANAGFCFVKFNFSHNGGTIEQPMDFPDLEAFGNNNYSKELDDLNSVIEWVCENSELSKYGNINNISLLGHSRGGGIAIIMAEENPRIKRVIGLASVSDFAKRTATIDNIGQWRRDGVKFVENSRTKQLMPHYFQFYEDFIQKEKRLTIKRAAENLKIPHLIIHGSADTSVSVNEALELHAWNAKSKLVIIEGANHVFGTKHPQEKVSLSKELQQAVSAIIDFINIDN